MKVDSKGVSRAFKELPRKQRAYIFKAIRKSVNEGVRLAKTLAPKDTGDLAQGIHAKYEIEPNAIVGSVEAAPSDARSQIKALAVERVTNAANLFTNCCSGPVHNNVHRFCLVVIERVVIHVVLHE